VVAALAALALVAVVLAVALAGGDDGGSGGESSAFDAGAVKITPVAVKTPSGMATGEGRLWVSSAETDTVTSVDLESGEQAKPIAVGDGPTGLVVDNGSVWVVNSDASTISRIDIDRGDVVGNPVALTSTGNRDSIAAGDNRIFVAAPEEGRVVAIDQSTGRRGPAIDLPDGTVGEIAVAGGALWVVGDHGTVTRVDTSSGQAGEPIKVGSKLDGDTFRGEIATDGDAVWVAGLDDETVTRVDAASGRVVETIGVPDHIEGDIAAADGYAWVVDERNELVRIDGAKNAIAGAPIPSGTSGSTDLLAGGGVVWVTGDFERNSVSRVEVP
jgi:streptogramin lyase